MKVFITYVDKLLLKGGMYMPGDGIVPDLDQMAFEQYQREQGYVEVFRKKFGHCNCVIALTFREKLAKSPKDAKEYLIKLVGLGIIEL